MLNTLRNLRISVKIMLPLALMALVALGVGGFISQALISIDNQYNDLVEREAKAATDATLLNLIAVDLPRATWRAIGSQDSGTTNDSIRQVEAMATRFAGVAEAIRPVVAGTPRAAELAGLLREFQRLQPLALRSLTLLAAGQTQDALKVAREDLYAPLNTMRVKTQELAQTMNAAAAARSAALAAEGDAAVRNALLALGFGVAISLALGVWLTRFAVIQPFTRLNATMQRLAGGDLTVQVGDTDRGDEIGGMARALQGFASGLRDAAALRTEQQARDLRAEEDRKAAMLSLAGNLEQTVGGVVDGVASAAAELNAAATSMVAIAESTSGRAGVVSNASAEASGNVNTVAAATEELAASVAEISRQVADSARLATNAVDQARRTDTTVANLTDAAAKIGEVTRLIGDIAGQTNLLALNATIEAARAGEAGKGFAVVASEVKALANQTAQATGSIATQIQAMQAATRDAAADIGAIRDSIGHINEVTAAIAAAVEEQGAATRDIAQNVQRAAAGTNEIAEAIDGVTAAAAETGGAAGQVQATSATLAVQSDTLRREVGDFLHRLRAA